MPNEGQMENRRTGPKIPRDEKSTTGVTRSSERMKREERRLREAMEDDDVFEALKRLHHEPGADNNSRKSSAAD